MIEFKLFLEFIKIGSFSFGGGFATLPFIYQLAEQTGWISLEEVNKIVTISQMTPGPLACNIATYLGAKLDGIIRFNCCYNCFCNTSYYIYDYYI